MTDDRVVPLSHLLGASVATRLTVGQITRRLTELGYTVRHHLPEHVIADSSDQLLLDRQRAVTAPRETIPRFTPGRIGDLLDPAQPVPAGHLIAAAATTGLTIGQALRRLREFGYTVQHRLPDELRTSHTDARLVSTKLMRPGSWLDPGQPVPAAHLIAAMNWTGLPIDQLVRRFTELGYQASDVVDIPPGLGLPEGVRIRLR
ncbi:hypothetical protein V6U90_17585 [Micromonospora sp. CPCC 206060]